MCILKHTLKHRLICECNLNLLLGKYTISKLGETHPNSDEPPPVCCEGTPRDKFTVPERLGNAVAGEEVDNTHPLVEAARRGVEAAGVETHLGGQGVGGGGWGGRGGRVMEEGRKRVRKERTEGGGRSKTIGRLLSHP